MAAPATGKRVLLIDDDQLVREIFALEMAKDFRVAVAEDGAKGLAEVAAFKPHLIVLDLMMPFLDGFEVIQQLQARGFKDIPVLVITGDGDQANESIVSKEPNVVAFLRKPLKFNELIVKINGLLAA